MPTKLLLAIILVSLMACKKQVTERNLMGTFTLDAVREMKSFSRPKIVHSFTGAKFVFNNADQVICYKGTDTLYGNYILNERNNGYYDNEGNYQTQSEDGLYIFVQNPLRTNTLRIQLWKLRYRNNRSEMQGQQERVGNDYLFEFKRN
jgi:hypothetical protein